VSGVAREDGSGDNVEKESERERSWKKAASRRGRTRGGRKGEKGKEGVRGEKSGRNGREADRKKVRKAGDRGGWKT